ncbi:MAG: phosphoribosyltransferase [Adhaeribacter sp.]|nr:phosphoribosyltransferase [Adhaeribacter sp.]
MADITFDESNRILDRNQIMQKIKRMAYELYENNFQETDFLLAGIQENGFLLAQLLEKELKQIAAVQVELASISLDKIHPLDHSIVVEPNNLNLAHRVVILVDDVLNTGKTLAYSMQFFLKTEVKKIETATLINRHHTLYPINATYTGLSLSTTLPEHIRVILAEGERFGAYLI